ncbi:MAG: DUF3160 domain-containing protein [Spirochaetales bacterium]|nr:DUF3160 domain-containing protein [Spirochaetales bacterium]
MRIKICVLLIILFSTMTVVKVLAATPAPTPPNQETFQAVELPEKMKLQPLPERKPVKVSIPQKYLKEKLKFVDPPHPLKGKSGQYAVIGTNKAPLFLDSAPKSENDLKKIKKTGSLPIGTILPIKSRYSANERDWFYFEDHYNFFYKTIYKGKPAMVFGADIALVSSDIKAVEEKSFFYTRPFRSKKFYNKNGTRAIEPQVQKALTENLIAFEKVKKNEYWLDTDYPDDLISLYQKESGTHVNTLFITTDLFSHSIHLIFDRLLSHIEEQYLLPELYFLAIDFIKEINSLMKEDTGAYPKYTRALEKCLAYFQVAEALLETAPQVTVTEDDFYPPEESYEDVDIAGVLEKFPELVKKEVNLILAAGGFNKSPNFGYLEDYSQFKPRGHYTKNGRLMAYFRTMMWFGRVHFYLSSGKSSTMTAEEASAWGYKTLPDDYEGGENALSFSVPMTRITLILTQIARQKKNIMDRWALLFDPITYLIGQSDDLNFRDIFEVLSRADMKNPAQWMENDGNVLQFIKYAESKTRPPFISSTSVRLNPSEENKKDAARGYRLFGQRFTLDSYIHNQLCNPRIDDPRNMVMGLDVMAAFGSKRALSLLSNEMKLYPGYKAKLNEMKKQVQSFDTGFWNASFYSQYLSLIKSIGLFETGSGFYFSQKPAWGIKSLLTAHGAWAELRHDTILYVKQGYAEMGGEEEATYRTEPVPRPCHMIEPNLPFFHALEKATYSLMSILNDNRLLPKFYYNKLDRYLDLVRDCITIVEKEVQNKPVSEDDNNKIPFIAGRLAALVLPEDMLPGGFMQDTDQLKMALIADVHTDAFSGEVLEVGTGIPLRIYVALNDGQGGKRIATGYTYSYYEFTHPMNDRLTDEQWKTEVYDPEKSVDDKMPFWLKENLPLSE